MDDLAGDRDTLHRVAAHVLGRRRHQVSGRFGLRATPGGFGTPAFGDEPESLRVSGTTLVREVGGTASYVPIAGSTLRSLAAFVGSDISASFSVGEDGPPVGDADSPLALDPAGAEALATWFALGWRILDEVVSELALAKPPATVQLWPEHFDAGTNVALASGAQVNLGASPGDDSIPEPYLYVGPWGPERPGDASFWNAPFGAMCAWSALGDGNVLGEGVRFLRHGVALLAGTAGS
jgi:hypothetical protein